MTSLLMVSVRPGKKATATEYDDVLRTSGLRREELDHHVFDEAGKDFSIEGYDGIIVGGSPLNVLNATYTEWQHAVHATMGQLIDADVPVLFICYGNSLVAHLSGGKVDRSYPEDAGPSVVELTDDGQRDPLTRGLPSAFHALSGHTESIGQLPASATLLASGPTCPVQIVRANETTWATQFHPELDAEGFIARIGFYANHGYYHPEDYDRIVASARRTDTSAANRIMRNFVAITQGQSPR